MTEKPKQPKSYAMALSKAWGNHFPVGVREIAQEVSAKHADPISKIESLPIGEEDFEGVLIQGKKSKKWGLAYSAHIREDGKINFTIAHEFGHYMLHRKEHNQFACTEDDLRNFPYATEEARNLEQEANEFASYLLMPANDFRAQVDGQRVNIDLMSHCANRYATSLAASVLKLIDFIDRPIAIIVSENGVVKWSRSSQRALRQGLWFKRGTSIPDKSISMRCAQMGVSQNCSQGQELDQAIWLKSMPIVESAIAQPYYRTVFTLLESTSSGHDKPAEDDFDDVRDSFDHFRSYSR